MSVKYQLTTCMEHVPTAQPTDPSAPIVEALTTREFADAAFGTAEAHAAIKALSAAESTYADVFPRCVVGSFAVPDKRDPLGDPHCFAFYLDKMHLVFIDESDACERLLGTVAASGMMRRMTTAHCLIEFMRQLTKDDLEYLAGLEDRMENEEEAMLDRCEEANSHRMLLFRRMMLRMNTYYQQLSNMASVLSENEGKALSPEEARQFLLLARQEDRLLKRSQTLKEYSLQLRELYQTRIDIQQNDTIQWFTVVTTLFAPLTLLTGWFGMNFQNMPGLDWPGAYYVVIAASLAITASMLAFFHRKGWL